MPKIRAGYLAVHCDIEPEGDLARLTFKRADGKLVLVTLTAPQVQQLTNALLNLLAPEDDATDLEVEDVTV